MAAASSIGWQRDEDGVVILTLDRADKSVNTMDSTRGDDIDAAFARFAAERD